ncbi:MAG: hypothetical protein HQ546_08025 [Planctomycetes bacterium]|nr:hypothetical protein [Planctomycetota bacterium]
MGPIEFSCPECHACFRVAESLAGKRARCKRCGNVFVIQALSVEDSIMGWLTDGGELPDEVVSSSAGTRITPLADDSPNEQVSSPRHPEASVAEPEERLPLRLSKIDETGAMFVFAPSLLEDEGFRSSMPRCCIRCGVTHSLDVRLVLWAGKSTSRDSAPPAKSAVARIVRAESLRRLSGHELLASLPHVPKMPAPFDLPMPYFVCHCCPAAEALFARVHPIIGGDEQCELTIASLKRAAEFLARGFGRDHVDYPLLIRELQRRNADPWGNLPAAVRNRIQHWFKPAMGEYLVCYVRDTDFAEAQDGQGGLVLSDRRLVFHKYGLKKEIRFVEPMELHEEDSQDLHQLFIGRAGEKPFVLNCDPEEIQVIRQALRKAGAKCTFRTKTS